MHRPLDRAPWLTLGFLTIVIVGSIFFDVLFFDRTLQPSNTVPHMGKPVDWQASAAILPVFNPDARASDGFADLNASAWQFEPARYWMARNFREGQSPWWNPFSASGTLGPEVLVDIKFSPHTVISAWLFDASPASFDFGLVVVYCIGVFFVMLILRQLFSLDWLPVIAGALVYLLNGYAIPNLNTHIGQPYFYSPVLLFAVLYFVQRQALSRWIFLVVAHAILLTINILTTMTLVLVTVHLIGLAYWMSVNKERQFFPVIVRHIFYLVSGFLVALLLDGPLWFPVIQSFFVTDMVMDFESRALQPARSIDNLLSVFTPKHFWQELAYPPRFSLYPAADLEKSNGLIAYMGIAASCIAGLAIRRRGGLANVVPLVCIALAALCYFRVFGYMDLINALPVFRSIGNQYWGCMSAIALFLLVPLGMQNVRNGSSLVTPAVFILVIQFFSFCTLLDKLGLDIGSIYRFYLLVSVAVFVLCAAILFVIKRGALNAIFMPFFILSCIVLELIFYMNPVRPVRYDPVAYAPGFVRFIKDNIGDGRVLNIGQDNTLYPEYGAMFGIKQADTQNPGLFPWYESFFDRHFGNDTFLFLALDGSMEKKRKKTALKDHILDEDALDVASVRYLVVADAAENYIRFLQERQYPVVYRGSGVSIFENANYIHSVSLASASLGKEVDTTRVDGNVGILSYRNTEVVVEAETASAATLVLSDTWSPAWKATLDGKEIEVRRVNETFRGVALPAGKHSVVFYYELTAFKYGCYVSLLALLLIGGIYIGSRLRGSVNYE